jgi:hypothetical protein
MIKGIDENTIAKDYEWWIFKRKNGNFIIILPKTGMH